MGTPRMFAVIPAAGLSRRMGEPKLLLEFGGLTVLERVLNALKDPRITDRFIVTRNSDQRLVQLARQLMQTPICPEFDPPDMRSSVEVALAEIARRYAPLDPDQDAWMLIPADHPVVDAGVVTRLLDQWKVLCTSEQGTADALIPCHQERSGHPAIFRWRVAELISRIPRDQGLNWLKRSGLIQVELLETDSPGVLVDLDTPEDWRRLNELWSREG